MAQAINKWKLNTGFNARGQTTPHGAYTVDQRPSCPRKPAPPLVFPKVLQGSPGGGGSPGAASQRPEALLIVRSGQVPLTTRGQSSADELYPAVHTVAAKSMTPRLRNPALGRICVNHCI